MESLRNNAAAIMVELETLGFVSGSGADNECGVLVRRNTSGHPMLRVCLVFASEDTLNNISVHGFDGSAGEIIDWHMDITGGTPTRGVPCLHARGVIFPYRRGYAGA